MHHTGVQTSVTITQVNETTLKLLYEVTPSSSYQFPTAHAKVEVTITRQVISESGALMFYNYTAYEGTACKIYIGTTPKGG